MRVAVGSDGVRARVRAPVVTADRRVASEGVRRVVAAVVDDVLRVRVGVVAGVTRRVDEVVVERAVGLGRRRTRTDSTNPRSGDLNVNPRFRYVLG